MTRAFAFILAVIFRDEIANWVAGGGGSGD